MKRASPGMSPQMNQLKFHDSESQHTFQIDEATCGSFIDDHVLDDRVFFLTFRCRAATQPVKSPADFTPWVEINIPFDSEPIDTLATGLVLSAKDYDEELYNLTNIYLGYHGPFGNPQIRINKTTDSYICLLYTSPSPRDRG